MANKSFRLAAAEVVAAVVDQQRSLDSLLRNARQASLDDAAKLSEIAYGSVRWYCLLDAVLGQLLAKPLRSKDRIVHFLLLVAIYQIHWMRTPDHAVVDETVRLTKKIKREWARGMVNAVLRNFIRQRDSLLQQEFEPAVNAALPPWMYQQIAHDWPQQLDDYRGD